MNLNMPWSRREDVIQYFSLIPVLHCHDKLDLNLGNFYSVPGSCREEKGLPLSWRIADIDFVECWCLWLVTFHWWITKKEWLLCTLERAQITGFQLLFPWQIFSLYTFFFFSLSFSLFNFFMPDWPLKAPLQVVQTIQTGRCFSDEKATVIMSKK